MRSLLLFIGSVLYPVVMVVISPVVLFAYFLLGFTLLTRYAHARYHYLLTHWRHLPALQTMARKGLALRPKAMH